MAARKLVVFFAIMLALLVGCAAGQGGLFGRVKPGDDRQAKLAERIRLLDIDWEIVIKDDPPQPDTVGFRANLAAANQALAAGRREEAEKALADAEAWMVSARPRYYREHEARVVAGSSKETSDALMTSALDFMHKGLKAKDAGDQVGAQKYLQAATEEGELALSASGRTLQGPETFTKLVEQMSTIYAASGHPERTAELHSRIVRSLQAGIDASDRQIQARLKNNAPGFEEATLTKDKAAVDKAIKDLDLLYQQYRRQVEYANAFAPGEIRSYEYGLKISEWKGSWLKFHEPPPISDPNRFNHDRDNDPNTVKQCSDARGVHNQLKNGALPVAGSGIVIEESEVFTQGTQVVIRGKVQNLRNQPILNPRITVTGGVFSEMVDLGYASMNPPQTTTFMVALECFTNADFGQAGGRIPAHELLLIFKEPNGTERKLIVPIGARSGN